MIVMEVDAAELRVFRLVADLVAVETSAAEKASADRIAAALAAVEMIAEMTTAEWNAFDTIAGPKRTPLAYFSPNVMINADPRRKSKICRNISHHFSS